MLEEKTTFMGGISNRGQASMEDSSEHLLEEKNVAIIVRISAKIPIFEPLLDEFFQISDVPICTNCAEPYEFQKYLLQKKYLL